MKKTLLLLSLLLSLASCSTTLKYAEVTDIVDYGLFAQKGIYVSPYKPNSDNYQFLGDVTMYFIDGYAPKADVPKHREDLDFVAKPFVPNDLIYYTATEDDMISTFAKWMEVNEYNVIFDFAITKFTDFVDENGNPRSGRKISGIVGSRK